MYRSDTRPVHCTAPGSRKIATLVVIAAHDLIRRCDFDGERVLCAREVNRGKVAGCIPKKGAGSKGVAADDCAVIRIKSDDDTLRANSMSLSSTADAAWVVNRRKCAFAQKETVAHASYLVTANDIAFSIDD